MFLAAHSHACEPLLLLPTRPPPHSLAHRIASPGALNCSIIFVLDARADPSPSQSSHKAVAAVGHPIKQFKQAVANLAGALKCEEQRCGYVSDEVQLMLSINEDLHESISTYGDGDDSANSAADSDSDQVGDTLTTL